MTGAVIAIDDASAADTILSVKERVFAANPKLYYVRRQRLIYRPGPCGIEPLADAETLGGAGVAQDGLAELDVLLAELAAQESTEFGMRVFASVCSGSTLKLRELLDQGAGVEFKNKRGYTALVHAAAFGHADCLQLLIDAGADTEVKEESTHTALCLAAQNGHSDCVQLLVAGGANKETKDEYGCTALMWAAFMVELGV